MIMTIDVGGTKTLVSIFSEGGELMEKTRFETPKEYSEFLKLLEKNIASYLEKNAISACSIGMPGRIDHAQGAVVAFGNLPWRNVKIIENLRSVINSAIPIYLENDSKLAGLSEALDIPEHKRVIYITVSTGIGTGFYVDGRLDKLLGNSEAGQAEIEYNGKVEKWEHFASGSAIVRTYGKRASDIDDVSTWKEISHKISLGLFELVALLQPDAIVFGGGVGAHLDKFKHFIEAELSAHPNPLVNVPVILQAQRAEDAVLYGGYALAKQMQTDSN